MEWRSRSRSRCRTSYFRSRKTWPALELDVEISHAAWPCAAELRLPEYELTLCVMRIGWLLAVGGPNGGSNATSAYHKARVRTAYCAALSAASSQDRPPEARSQKRGRIPS
jgi:hypothetical protein